MMTLKELISSMRDAAKLATQGPYFKRIDFDYYQGGCYLGVGPYKYVSKGEAVSCSPSDADGFDRDVLRVEGTQHDEDYLLLIYPDNITRLLDAHDVAEKALNSIVKYDDRFTQGASMDWEGVIDVARTALKQINGDEKGTIE